MKYKFGTWNIRGLAGSVRDAERKTYELLNILARYGILTETKHHGGSYEEVSGTKHIVLCWSRKWGKKSSWSRPGG